jgi:hypothetical protein
VRIIAKFDVVNGVAGNCLFVQTGFYYCSLYRHFANMGILFNTTAIFNRKLQKEHTCKVKCE